MIIKKNSKQIKISVKKVSSLGKITGLMFKTKNTKNLLFEFEKSTHMAIHSCFVFFDFLAVWVDGKNKILEYKIVRPFTACVRPRREFRKLVEIPLNERNRKVVKLIVGRTTSLK